jgi:hypothetical protein
MYIPVKTAVYVKKGEEFFYGWIENICIGGRCFIRRAQSVSTLFNSSLKDLLHPSPSITPVLD